MRTVVLVMLISSVLAIALPAAATGPDPLQTEQWGLDAIHAQAAWATTRGEGTVIAIVDSGVDPDHPDLRDKLTGGSDFVGDGNGIRDLYGHGTHVAGIAAAATGNSAGIAGCAPDAKIMPIRVLNAAGEGTSDHIAQGVRWAAAHGADVINLSLGEEGIGSRLTKGGPLNAAIREADAAGSVVVAAAGNGNKLGRGRAQRNYRLGVAVTVVNAIDQIGNPTAFTNYGDARSLAAPGTAILSTTPTYPTTLFLNPHGGYAALDGTSMATPFVACGAALLSSLGLRADQIADVLRQTATPGKDPRLGQGVVDLAAAVAAGATQVSAGHNSKAPAQPPDSGHAGSSPDSANSGPADLKLASTPVDPGALPTTLIAGAALAIVSILAVITTCVATFVRRRRRQASDAHCDAHLTVL